MAPVSGLRNDESRPVPAGEIQLRRNLSSVRASGLARFLVTAALLHLLAPVMSLPIDHPDGELFLGGRERRATKRACSKRKSFELAQQLGTRRHLLQHYTPIVMCPTRGGHKKGNTWSSHASPTFPTLPTPTATPSLTQWKKTNHVHPKSISARARIASDLAKLTGDNVHQFPGCRREDLAVLEEDASATGCACHFSCSSPDHSRYPSVLYEASCPPGQVNCRVYRKPVWLLRRRNTLDCDVIKGKKTEAWRLMQEHIQVSCMCQSP